MERRQRLEAGERDGIRGERDLIVNNFTTSKTVIEVSRNDLKHSPEEIGFIHGFGFQSFWLWSLECKCYEILGKER